MRRKIIALAALTCLLLTAAPATAQTYSEERVEPAKTEAKKENFQTFSLGDIVVSAEQGQSYQVAIMDVMDEEEIKATNSKTLAEALQYIPGMVVDWGRKDEPRISMNGFSGSRILVMLDGVPFYETSYRTLNLDQIPTAVVSRIEVTKGAPSVLYGPNAMGGVINVITKKGGEMPSVSAYAEAGRYNTYNYGASLGGSYGMFNGWLSVDHRERDAYAMSGKYKEKLGTLTRTRGGGGAGNFTSVLQDDKKRANSDRDTTSVWARVGIEPSANSEYFLSFHYVTRDGGSPNGVDTNAVNYFTPDAFTQLNRWDLYEELGFDFSGRQQIFDGFVVTGKLFYHQHKDKYESYWFNWDGISSGQTGSFGGIFGPPNADGYYDPELLDLYGELAARSVYEDYMFGGQLIGDWQINDMHTIRASFQMREDGHKQKGDEWMKFDDYKSTTGSLGLEYQLSLFEKALVVTPGVSYDWFKIDKGKFYDYSDRYTYEVGHPDLGDTKDSWNPMIGVNFVAPASMGWFAGTEIYGSVAHKTRFPTLREQASSSNANPDLKAEKSTNFTLGIARNFFEGRVRLGLAGYYNNVKDLINTAANRHTSGSGTYYYNLNDVEIYGFQFNAEYQPIEYLTLSFDYTYNHGKDKSNDAPTKKVQNLYKHKIGLGATINIPEITTRLDIRGYYISDVYTSLPNIRYPNDPEEKAPGYFVMNARLSKTFFNDTLEVYGYVNNIFDRCYGGNFVAPGRTFMVGTRVSF